LPKQCTKYASSATVVGLVHNVWLDKQRMIKESRMTTEGRVRKSWF